MITKENMKELKQLDRIELLNYLGLLQGKYTIKATMSASLLIITAVIALMSPLIAFILWIISLVKVIKDNKKYNKEVNEKINEYFTIKPRSKY